MTEPAGTDLAATIRASRTLATGEQLIAFTDTWLANRRLSEHTRDAYRRDVRAYLAWCDKIGLPPLTVRFTHINGYARGLEAATADGRPLTATTIARKLSSVSSWYAFLVKMDVIEANPVDGADRPTIDRNYTAAVSLSATEAAAMLAAASTDRYLGDACAAALLAFMVAIGARVSEVCALDIEHLGHERGHRTVALRAKGGKRPNRAMPPQLGAAIDAYLAQRATTAGVPVEELRGALFVTPAGTRLDRFEVYRFVRRAARAAGLPNADQITPHSFRHAWATIARAAGVDLERRQYALGHADPRTTQRYDHTEASLDADPSYDVAAHVAAAVGGLAADRPRP